MTDQQNSLNRILVTVGSALAAIGIVALLLAASADHEPARNATTAEPTTIEPASSELQNASVSTLADPAVIVPTVTAAPVSVSPVSVSPVSVSADSVSADSVSADSVSAALAETTAQTLPGQGSPESPAFIVTDTDGLTVPMLAEACKILNANAAQQVADANDWSTSVNHVADLQDAVYCAPPSIKAQGQETLQQLADTCRIETSSPAAPVAKLVAVNAWTDGGFHQVKKDDLVHCVPQTIDADTDNQPHKQLAYRCRIGGTTSDERATALEKLNGWDASQVVAANDEVKCW